MVDHNVLRSEISSARRYRELKNLELSISGLKHSLPISLYTELNGRIREKVMSFDYPNCEISRIRVIYSNGLSKPLEKDECHSIMAMGIKLPDYVFSHYVSARDIEILDATSEQKIPSESINEENSDILEGFTELGPAALRERIDFLLKKVENLEKIERIYSDSIPKIVREMDSIREKVEKIYSVVVKE